jgi:eukaryotic-like serine/threonine-protein kinase
MATPEDQDYAQLKALFNAVCDLPDDAARQRHLDELAADPALAARVLAMLRAAPLQTARFAAPAARLLAIGAEVEGQAGDVFGAWTLVSEIGSGGMGRVFLAERSDGHFRQRAALKLLRAWGNADALALLAQERQILASLTHPGIARLLDGGATPRGAPYLVMEYIEGEPIDAAAARHALGADALVRQLLAVCDALAYAHRQFVVHCDIKPSNLLVDGDGRVHLLDFGVARLLGQEAGSATAVGMTPRYASPEQIAGHAPSAASDVYGLGRVLEELLSLPHVKAPRPREWRAIVARATAADPAARYLDVPAMARDLERWLGHRPLQALPRRWHYIGAKFVRRRWPWVLAALGVMTLSLGFTLQLAKERDAAIAARLQAERETQTTRRISDFVISLFDGADPRLTGRPDLPAAALVDQGRQRVDAELGDRPALQAEMKAVLARVYDSIGQPMPAIALYREAAALEARPDLARPLREAEALSRLATVLNNDSQHGLAEVQARRALELRQRHAAGDLALADSHNSLGLALTYLGRHDQARAQLDRALALRLQRLEPNHIEIAVTLHNLGVLEERAGSVAAAERSFAQALQMKRLQWPETHPSVLNTQEMLAVVLTRQRRWDDAIVQFRRLIDLRAQVHGAGAASVWRTRAELASTLQDAGRLDEAVPLYRQTLAAQRELHGAKSARVGITLNNLASALALGGEVSAAEAAWRESLAIREAATPVDGLAVARVQNSLGTLLLALGRAGEAKPPLQAALAAREAGMAAGHGQILDSRIALAELALFEADPQAPARVAALQEPPTDDADAGMRRAALRRVQALAAARAGHAAEATKLHGEARQAAVAAVGEAHPLSARYAVEHAAALAASGERRRAAALLAPRLAALLAQPTGSPWRQRAEAVQKKLQGA